MRFSKRYLAKVQTMSKADHELTRLTKHFQSHQSYLVSDPNSSLRTGDVVRIENEGRQISRHIKHVVTEILAPWGPGIDERPPVLSGEERHQLWKEKYDAKIARRTGRPMKVEGSREPREDEGETSDDKVEGMVEGTQIAS